MLPEKKSLPQRRFSRKTAALRYMNLPTSLVLKAPFTSARFLKKSPAFRLQITETVLLQYNSNARLILDQYTVYRIRPAQPQPRIRNRDSFNCYGYTVSA